MLPFVRWLLREFHRELQAIKTAQLEQGQKLMAAIDDLKTAVADLNTSISSEIAAVSAKLSSLPTGGTSDADIAAVVTQLNAAKATLDAETASLTAPVVPAPTV